MASGGSIGKRGCLNPVQSYIYFSKLTTNFPEMFIHSYLIINLHINQS